MQVTRSVAVAQLLTTRLIRLSMRKDSLRRKIQEKKDCMLRFSLEQQRICAFEVYQTFLVCRQHAFQLFTDLYGEQDAQLALSPLLLGISNLTVTVGREITTAKSPHGTLQVSYTNATSVPEVIEAHTGYAVTKIPSRPFAD
jgi:hypothetical protein